MCTKGRARTEKQLCMYTSELRDTCTARVRRDQVFRVVTPTARQSTLMLTVRSKHTQQRFQSSSHNLYVFLLLSSALRWHFLSPRSRRTVHLYWTLPAPDPLLWSFPHSLVSPKD